VTAAAPLLDLPPPHDDPASPSRQFYVFSVRAYEHDFRQFLIAALRRQGHRVCHIHIGRSTRVTDDGGTRSDFPGAAGFLRLLRRLRASARSAADPVFIDSTGPYTPVRSLALRAALGPGIWCYDIFDNMSYDYRGWMRLRTGVAIRVLCRLSPVQLTLSRETLRLFPSAIHLDNAAHTGPITRTAPNDRDLVLLSSIDERLDIEFVRRLAALAPDRSLFVYGRAASAQRLDALLHERPNIVYRGEFGYGDIDAILAPFSVALAPYAINKLTEYINPDKYYYFLNSRMEVISTDIPQARRMRERIHIAQSPADVPTIMERLRADPKFRKNAAGPVIGWDQRASELVEIIARAGAANPRSLRSRDGPAGRRSGR
jgi:hypothetical protein